MSSRNVDASVESVFSRFLAQIVLASSPGGFRVLFVTLFSLVV